MALMGQCGRRLGLGCHGGQARPLERPQRPTRHPEPSVNEANRSVRRLDFLPYGSKDDRTTRRERVEGLADDCVSRSVLVADPEAVCEHVGRTRGLRSSRPSPRGREEQDTRNSVELTPFPNGAGRPHPGPGDRQAGRRHLGHRVAGRCKQEHTAQQKELDLHMGITPASYDRFA
jgi:hypothetical protein